MPVPKYLGILPKYLGTKKNYASNTKEHQEEGNAVFMYFPFRRIQTVRACSIHVKKDEKDQKSVKIEKK